MISYADEYTFARYYSILLLHIHPLLQLKYKLDPQVAKLSKFLLIFARVVISMCICFMSLYMLKSLDSAL
jgi:hypothetical protein